MARSTMRRIEVLIPHAIADAIETVAADRKESLSYFLARAGAKVARVKFDPPKSGRPKKNSGEKPHVS